MIVVDFLVVDRGQEMNVVIFVGLWLKTGWLEADDIGQMVLFEFEVCGICLCLSNGGSKAFFYIFIMHP